MALELNTDYTESEKMSLMVAGGAIVFSIIAILAYIYTGGGIIFYVIAIITLALEFYMAYRISQEGKEEPKKQQQRKPRK